MFRKRIPAFILFGVAIFLIVADRITKWLVEEKLALGHSVRAVHIGDFEIINFTHIRNSGAAFGILSGKQTFLIIVTSIFLAFALVVLFSGKYKSKFVLTAIALIFAGGVGNLIDRVSYNYVVDFIEFGFVSFAVFNVADVCAVVGAFMLFIAVISEEIRDYKARKACGDLEDSKE